VKLSIVGRGGLPACVLVFCWLLVPSWARGQEWSRFEWVSAEMGGRKFERAAILLPVKIKGVAGDYYMQLDTGSPRTLLYGVPYGQLLRGQGAPGTVARGEEGSGRYTPSTFNGSVGASELSDVPVLLYGDYGSPLSRRDRHPKIGTIGLDLFRERTLILDFPKRRFALLKSGEAVPASLEKRAQFFDVTLKDGLLFLPVLYEGRPLGQVFYDTGSSVFPLVVRRDLWRRLTGHEGDEPDNERRTTYSWGRRYVMTGARTLKPFAVGPLNVADSTAFYAPAEAAHLSFERSPYGADGLVGNAPFYDEHTVIIDLPRKRMGLLRNR
jgi:hypothetical protein